MMSSAKQVIISETARAQLEEAKAAKAAAEGKKQPKNRQISSISSDLKIGVIILRLATYPVLVVSHVAFYNASLNLWLVIATFILALGIFETTLLGLKWMKAMYDQSEEIKRITLEQLKLTMQLNKTRRENTKSQSTPL